MFVSLIVAGEDTSISNTAYVITTGTSAKLVAGYFNYYASYYRIYFTPDANFTQLSVYVAKTASGAAIGGCTGTQFDNIATIGGVDGGGGGGTIWAPDGGGNITQAEHYIDVSYSSILTAIGGSWADAEGSRLYIAIKLGTSDDWACARVQTDNGITLDNGQTDGTYYYHVIDRTFPTIADEVYDENDKELNDGTSTTALDNYTNSNKIKITIGSEAISTGGITYTQESGSGTTQTDSDALDGATASSTVTTTFDGLVDGTRYDIAITFNDAAGNSVTENRNNITYDTTAPTVDGVVSQMSNGSMYAEGTTVEFYVDFSEKINFNGAPKLTLLSNDGETTIVTSNSYSDGSQYAFFDWSVPDGAYSVYLDYQNTTALSAATGGYIQDYAGNTATLTLATPPDWGSQGENASLSQSATGGYFGVDGDDPAAFGVGAVVTTGQNVTANYWNGSNTGVSVTIPIANDNSLTDGTVQLRAEADGDYENLGGSYDIQSDDLNTNITMTASGSGTGNTDVTELAGFTNTDVLQFQAIITDKSGNATTGTASATTLTVDQAAPSIANDATGVTSTNGDYKLGESVDIVVNFSESVSISGTPQLTLNTSNTPGSANSAVDKSGLSGSAVTFEYTVGSTHYSTDLDYVNTSSLSAGTYIRDTAGNDATLTLPDVGTMATAYEVNIDGVSPSAFPTGTVVTMGAPVVSGYLNEDNTGINVTVPIANDASLENGKLYIQAKIGANNYANVSSAYTIASGDLNSNKTITAAESDVDGITSFDDGATISFTGLLEDYADGAGGTGNQTTGTASSTTLIVDQTDPSAFPTGAVTTVTEPVVSGYWNSHNTGLTVVVPVANDATLEDGWIQIIGKIASSSYEDVGDSVQIANGDLGGSVTVSITAAQFETINTSLSDEDVVTLNARIDDVAGNATTGTASGTTITVDQTPQTVSYVSSDTTNTNPFKIGDLVPITVKFNGTVNIVTTVGTPYLALDTDESPGTATSTAPYSSGTGSSDIIFRYTVAANEYSAELNYINTSSLALNSGTIRDVAGNNATLTLPGIAEDTALKQKKPLWIDGVVPGANTVDSVVTTGGTVMATYWNEDNTGATVKVLLSTSDASLEGGTIQLTAEANDTYENIGSSNSILAGDVTAGYKKISVTAANIDGLSGYSDQYPNPDVISFKAVVTDKAGNSTTHSVSATTLTVDETDPTAFTVDSVITITVAGEVVDGYWNEDNTGVKVKMPIANDGTLENGRIMIEAEADGSYEYIGSGSLYNNASYVQSDHADFYIDWTTIASSDINGYKYVTINGASTSAAIRELEELTNFSDGDEVVFRAIIMDAAGNQTTGSASSLTLTVDQTDPGTPVLVLKSSSDTGIDDGDKLTKDDTPTFTLTNLSNTDSVYLKVASDATTLAARTSIVVRDVTTSTTKDLTPSSYANGTYLVTAVAKDVAGNWGSDATNTFVRIDTIPPAVPIAPDLLEADDTGFQNNDNIIKTTQPHFVFTGLSATKDSLRLVIDAGESVGRDSIMSQVTTDTFRVSTALASGYHTAGVIAIDSAGNVQDTSAVLAFVLDTAVPSKPNAPDLINDSDTGESNSDDLTYDATPSILSANLEVGSINKLFAISSDTDTTQIAVDTVETGTSQLTLTPSTSISNDTYSFYSISIDTAGNEVSSELLQNVRIETVVPTASIVPADSLVRLEDSPLSITVTFNDGMSTSPQIAVDFAGDDDISATAMSNTTNDSIWTYSLSIPEGNDGTAIISISGTDNAGNSLTDANTSDRTILRVDNTNPVFTLLSPDSNSYVNHAKVGYKLSETSFSGNVTWERIGGTVDANSPHIATLTASELDVATTFADYSLTNIPTTLVTGTAYSITWSATDTAGNVSAASYITTPVYYDTTAPTAALAYSQYFATADSVVTITATFNERALPTPKVAIDYQGVDSDVSLTDMTIGSDSTVWTYAATIPGGQVNNGVASVSITATDLAGNSLRASDITGTDTLDVDNTTPSVMFTYDDPDTLVRFEDATLLITATFSDSITVDSIPKLTVDMPSGTNGDISAGEMTLVSGKVYNYSLPLVDKTDGIIAITISAYDKALNAIVADSIFRGSVVTIDNTDPSAFTTGTISAMGDTVVVSWLNNETDSLRSLIPISATDESLLDGGDVNVQVRVTGKMATGTWVTIATSDASSPSAPADSIKQLSGNQPFFRKKEDIITSLTPLGLAQGDTIRIRGSINDKVGNITYGTQSESFFVLDTLPPAQRLFFGDTLFTSNDVTSILTVNRDTLWTNDTIRFAFNNWVDSVKTNEKASGINRYEYALYQSTKATPDDTNPNDWTKFRDYRSITLDTANTDTFALTHNRKYYVALKAIDIAGNTSDTLNTFRTLRHNAYPVIDSIADTTVKEDVLWEQLLTVNDQDLLTIRYDKFTYALTTMKLDTTKTPIDSTAITTLTASVTTDGKVIFTPTKLDTAAYVFRVIVTDDWALKDTVDINITALPVNDPPIINLSSINKLTFLEGANSDSINLTQYSYDEDNDTTDLKYTFRIASKLPGKGGYPTAKTGFLSDFGDEFKKSFITRLVDEFPSSTIIQKNNAFLVYPANVNEYIDPIKIDSLVTGDSVFSWITPTDTASNDTNYYTSSDMEVEFTVTDPDGLSGSDTVTFFISPINDPPVWASIPDTILKENDSLYLDFANYLTDVDDSTLTLSILPLTYDTKVTVEPTKTFEKKTTGYVYSSNARKDTVKFKPAELWFKKDSGPWNPTDTLSNQIKFQITAADGDTSAIDTFILRVQRVPRPEIRMYVVQNNAFTNYYEIFLVDSVGKTQDLTLEVQSKAVTLDTAAAYTYVGHYDFKTKGTYTFEVDVTGIVGDTTVTQNLGLALAKMYGRWSGRSADGQFNVIGKTGAVDFDQSIMILDSTLFEPYFNDRASYLLGNEAFRFKKSVEISLPGDDEEMAIYQRSTGSGWVELPSITQGNRVMAYTKKMGYFRMGPKTLIVPGQTALQQNYPNPFNPVTTIEYDLGFVDGPFQKVNLTVYDILGRNVKTLVNEQQGIGRYRLKWNGKDQNDVPVASGIYFVHLLTDMGRSQSKKIMLLR